MVAEQRDGIVPPEASVLVACSGGADSLALLSAAVFEGHKLGLRVIGVTVDHGLQEESAAHAGHVVLQMAELRADETASARVEVHGEGVLALPRSLTAAVASELLEYGDAGGQLSPA